MAPHLSQPVQNPCQLEPRKEVPSFFKLISTTQGPVSNQTARFLDGEGWAVGRLEEDFAGWEILSSADERWWPRGPSWCWQPDLDNSSDRGLAGVGSDEIGENLFLHQTGAKLVWYWGEGFTCGRMKEGLPTGDHLFEWLRWSVLVPDYIYIEIWKMNFRRIGRGWQSPVPFEKNYQRPKTYRGVTE